MRQAYSVNHQGMRNAWALLALAVAMLGTFLHPAPVQAQELGIVAVVNDEPISSLDMQARMRLALANAGAAPSPQALERLGEQLLRTIIDERLQAQEMERQNVSVSQEEIDQALLNINKQRNAPPGTFEAFLNANNIPMSVVEDQLRAQIGWTKLVYQKLRGKVRIADDEIRRERERLAQGQEINEYQLSTMVLQVTTPEEEASVRELAGKLVEQARSGEEFSQLARQFSSGNAEMVEENQYRWVQMHQMEPVLAKSLLTLRPGDVGEPIRTTSGYQIIKLHDRRKANTAEVFDSEILIRQTLMKLKPTAEPQEAEVLLEIAREVAKHPGSCADQDLIGAAGMDDLNFETSFQRMAFRDVQPQLQAMLASLRVGDVTEPFATPQGIHLIMLCERIDMPKQLPPEEKIKDKIFQDKLALEADKMLRDLRREAFIEKRI